MRKQYLSSLALFLIIYFLTACGQLQTSDDQTRRTDEPESNAHQNHDSNAGNDSTSEQPVIANISSIADIKKAYALTMNQLDRGSLDSVVRDYNGNEGRSGSITYYSQLGNLVMVRHNYNEYDHHSTSEQYFIHNDKVYFVHSTQVSWNFVSAEVTQDHFTEQRTYILNDQSVLCLEKKYNILSNAPNERLDETENNVIACSTTESIYTDFKKLIAFRDQQDLD